MAQNISEHVRRHEKALLISGNYLKQEALLIGVFQELDQFKTYLHFNQPSLFAYATKVLKLGDSAALTLISIARKSRKIPDLKRALEEKRITLSNAKRIAGILTPENKNEWIEKASKFTQQQLDLELAKSFPERGKPASVRPKSAKHVRLETDLSVLAAEFLKRAQELLSQKMKTHVEIPQALEIVLKEFIEKHDPVKRAERAEVRGKSKFTNNEHSVKTEVKPGYTENLSERSIESLSEYFDQMYGAGFENHPMDGSKIRHKPLVLKRVQGPKSLKQKRIPIPASLRHSVMLRDQGRCTQCGSGHWVDIHHIQPVSQGGANTLENLQTLCSAHHRLQHYLEFLNSGLVDHDRITFTLDGVEDFQ